MAGFKEGDRVRLVGNVAFGPPDRRKMAGTVLRAWSDGTLPRLDVLFDGEDMPVLGLPSASYIHAG